MADIEIQNPELAVEDTPAQEPTPAPAPSPSKEPKSGFWWGTGRRKSSVARVRLKPGSGKTIVNKKDLNDYFKRDQDRKAVLAPLKAVKGVNMFDIYINVRGGGTTGQSGASLLGIARALRNYDSSCVQALRDSGHLTRDPRMVERKKPGKAGARKRFQFSKR